MAKVSSAHARKLPKPFMKYERIKNWNLYSKNSSPSSLRNKVVRMSFIEQYAELINNEKIVAPRRVKKQYFELVKHIHKPQFLPVLQPDGSFAEREFVFSETHANRPIDFIERFCKHSKGEWMGRDIRLELFQKAKFQAAFGFVDKETGLRRYTEVVTVEGRKNGKSTEISGIGNYMLCADGEGGPHVSVAATKLDQARIVFKEACNMVTQSPELRALITKRKSDLYSPFNFGEFFPVASDSDKLDGLNLHCGILDEIQANKDRNIYDILKQSTTARREPLLFLMGTGGFVRECLYDTVYEQGCNAIDGIKGFEQPRSLYFIYELDDREEWVDYRCWQKANPGLGTIKKFETLADFVDKARRDPQFLPTVLTKDFNFRETSESTWMRLDAIENIKVVPMDYLKKSYAIGGCDLSSTTDLTCATLLIRKPSTNEVFVLQQYFLPEKRVRDLELTKSKEAPYKLWAKQGWLTLCEGASVNFTDVTAWFVKMVKEYDIRPLWVCYDRALSGYWVPEMESCGFDMVKIAQGPFTWSQPMKELGAAFAEHRVVYQNNPMLRWCLSNVSKKSQNSKGIETIQPVKISENRRIDGFVSLLNAYVGLLKFSEEYLPYVR